MRARLTAPVLKSSLACPPCPPCPCVARSCPQGFTAAGGKGKPPEAVLNAAGSVWDIDPLVRQQRRSGGGDGGEGSDDDDGGDGGGGGARKGGEAGDGSDLFLAVGTGPLRQTDDPIDEVGFHKSRTPTFVGIPEKQQKIRYEVSSFARAGGEGRRFKVAAVHFGY